MLNAVKALIKMPRIISLNNKYKRLLDEQFVSYDSWIRQKELEYLAGAPQNMSDIQVVEYSQMSNTVPAGDVILYTADRSKLSERALYAVIAEFNSNPEAKIVYGDEDEYNSNRKVRMNPIFRPDWSPDTLMNYFYMGNVVAFRKDAIPETILRESRDIYELTVKASRGLTAKEVRHIDYVLYHNDYSKALYLDDKRFIPVCPNDALVSIVIPSKDNPTVLEQLISSILRLTTGVMCEIIIIDNGSNDDNQKSIKGIVQNAIDKHCEYIKDIRYIYSPQEFNFSKICNEGAGRAKGSYVLFLNDDMEIRDSKWLTKMLRYAALEHVGAVGAKLYYPESKMIQHVGITNLRLGPVHKLQYKPDDHVYYDHVNDVDRDVLGVTGACLMIKKTLFDEIGGFDENLKVAFNDVDLCYTLYERGFHNVLVNTTHLWHYESLSRGDDESKEKLERLMRERTRLYEKHPCLYGRDPYYHDYLTGDILDSNFTYAYEYEYDDNINSGRLGGVSHIKPKKITYNIKPQWHNECLIISLEQCGTLEYWLGPNESKPGDKNKIYIGGYSFVAGSDNSCFDFKLLLKNGNDIYEIRCNRLYRPDLEINLDPMENAALCGFSVEPDLASLKPGAYQVGVIARGLAARLVLCRFTNRYITVE